MTQPAWQSRSYQNGGGDGNFGSFASSDGNFGGGGNFRQEGPSMTAELTAEEMASPARDTKGKGNGLKNMFESGHNRPLSRHEVETWINDQCEPSFSNNRAKVDCMVEFFMSSKSASSSFRYLQKVRGPKFFGTFSNYFTAFDNEMMNAGLHDYTEFMKDTLFPKSGERPLHQLEMSIPDFIRSKQQENAMTRQFRSNSEFCGGSEYYEAKIEELREQRRKHPVPKKNSSNSSSSTSATSASEPVDISGSESPEMTKEVMVKMMKMQQKMLDKLTAAEAAESAESAVAVSSSRTTRSSEKAKKRQKK